MLLLTRTVPTHTLKILQNIKKPEKDFKTENQQSEADKEKRITQKRWKIKSKKEMI